MMRLSKLQSLASQGSSNMQHSLSRPRSQQLPGVTKRSVTMLRGGLLSPARRGLPLSATSSRLPNLGSMAGGNIQDIRELKLLEGEDEMALLDASKMRNVKVRDTRGSRLVHTQQHGSGC